MQAVILAAGEGSRLSPITDHTAKPIIPFWERPFISYLLDSLEGLVDEAIIVRPPGPELQDALGDRHGSLPLRYVLQQEPKGTGDATLRCREMIEGPFILNLGDTLAPRETIEALIAAPGDAVLTLIEVDDPENHNGIDIDEHGRVTDLWTDSNLVDAGVVRLPPEIFAALDDLAPQGNELRLMGGINLLLRAGGHVHSVITPQPWLQFGDHEMLGGVLRVMRQMCSGSIAERLADSSVDLRSHQGCDFRNSLVFGPGEMINCTVRDSMVYCATRLEDEEIDGEIAAYD